MRKDLDFSFNIHPLTGDLSTLSGSKAIKQSLMNIALTNIYERGYNLELYTNIPKTLFENSSSSVDLYGLKEQIKRSIENFEPQVELIDVQVNTGVDNDILIKIIYNEINNPEEQETIFQLR